MNAPPLNSNRVRIFALALVVGCSANLVEAASPPCRPCAGVRVTQPTAWLSALAAAPQLSGEARLYVAWPVELDGNADPNAVAAVRQTGATPWLEVHFRTASPLLEQALELERELAEVARLAAAAGDRAHLQIVWEPPSPSSSALKEYAFLLKRTAVAITGVQPEARVIAVPPVTSADDLRTFYAEEVAAYADGIALPPGPREVQQTVLASLTELDPGKPAVLAALPWPADPRTTVVQAAVASEDGFAVAFFDLGASAPDPTALAPLKLLAREFQGDLALAPDSTPHGARSSHAFVRGSDLGLRVIVERDPAGPAAFELRFPDPQLKSPVQIDLLTGEEQTVFGQRRTADSLLVPLSGDAPVTLLKLERMSAAELAGVAEEVTVASARDLPVEEILRRLQAFEDAQARKLDHYQAKNVMHLRFRLGNGVNTFEATFEGPFFYQRDQGFDWAWESFYVNGVKWRGRQLPELPLIQPEKSVALPLEILFNQKYRYRLRGHDDVAGRPAWVVDFTPLAVTPGQPLYRGTVWIDRELYARLKTQALQVGLEGEVLSNEETTFYSPVDALGQPAPWTAESYFLPLRVVGQQLLSILNSATQVEKETVLSEVRINGESYARERAAALASDATMVRDTATGLRYLVKDSATGERVVQTEVDTSRLFLVGGVFYDDSADFPIPLAGVNYLSLDFRGSGKQVNVFFGGALLIANLAEPRLFGSKWDAGANLFGFFIPLGDEQFRNGREVAEEEVEQRPLEVSLFLGRPLGNFCKLDFAYELEYDHYGRADDTAPEFILPQRTFTHNFEAGLSFSRAGYRASVKGIFSQRSDWEFWGLPGNQEFDPEHEDFVRYQVSLAKTWWLPKFFKFGLELEHLNGSDLDRFSKYDFSYFRDSRVRGYQGGLVRASEATGAHLTYGLNLGEVIRIELNGDAVWATDRASGLDRELLAGAGLSGTTVGPWNTVINFDLGYPVAGPAEDLVIFLAFLKLFH